MTIRQRLSRLSFPVANNCRKGLDTQTPVDSSSASRVARARFGRAELDMVEPVRTVDVPARGAHVLTGSWR
ncbi:MAG TPA: hypothetical protein VGF76_00195 [Polyangiaceae bacterium]